MHGSTSLFVACLSATAIGCSCDRQGTKEPADRSLVVRARDGVIDFDGGIPKGFPLSVLPGAKPFAAVAAEAPGAKRQILRLETEAGVIQAIEFYDRDLRRRGFAVERIEEEEEGISTSILRGKAVASGDQVDVAVKRRKDGSPGTVVRVTWTQAVPRP